MMAWRPHTTLLMKPATPSCLQATTPLNNINLIQSIHIIRFFVITFLIGISLDLSAQISGAERPPPGEEGTGGPGEGGAVTFDDNYDNRDTFGVFSFFASNPNQEISFSDSLLSGYYHQYDPTRTRDWDYANLGIVGSAHLPLIYESRFRKGLDVGYHQYDLYLTPASELPYYRLEKAFTNASYQQGAEQNDAMLSAQFSRNFANGLNYSLDYKRIAQKGSLNQYPRQQNQHTSIATGMWIHSKNGRYDGFLALAANTIEHQDNGGIAVEAEQEGFAGTPSSADVFLETAETRHQHREYAYTHYYRFGGQIDTLTNERKRAFTLSHTASYERNKYKFFDNNPAADSSYYGSFQVDNRGIRHFLSHNKLQNDFRLSTFKLRRDSTTRQRQQRDLLELGLSYSIHRLDQEQGDTVLTNLFASGKFSFNPNDRLRIEAYGHLGLWDNAGDFRASGSFFFDFKKLGNLKLEAVNQLYNPTFTQDRFVVSQRNIWDNDFKKTLETNITGTYSLPSAKFSITGGIHLLNNAIYYDTLARPVQTGVPVSIFQLIVKKNFEVGNFHLDNIVALQESTEDIIRLPGVYGKHSLYYQGKWFGVLNVKLGADLRFNNTYKGYYYNPLVGQFRLEDQEEIELLPATDLFFAMRVTRFRAYIKYENISGLFWKTEEDDPRKLYYQVATYAQPLGALRFGIKWRFVD